MEGTDVEASPQDISSSPDPESFTLLVGDCPNSCEPWCVQSSFPIPSGQHLGVWADYPHLETCLFSFPNAKCASGILLFFSPPL